MGKEASRVYRMVEHVGEVELELEGASEADVFDAAASAFRELVDGSAAAREPFRREIALGPDDAEILLADWLDELVFLAEVEGFVPLQVVELGLRGGRLRSVVEGIRGHPRHLVKGVTLHELALTQDEEGWHGRVVLDV